VKKFNSQLILLNVYSLPLPTYDSIPAIDRASQIQESSIAGLSELKQTVLNAGVDSEIICLSKNGSAIVQIKETLAEYKVEAIVMGITGDAGKLKEKIIGSTALDVARGVDIPLFIIPETVVYKNINKLSFACDIDNLYGVGSLKTLRAFAICLRLNWKL
jgi:nucleotide-binding universal stress UspA family protein